MGAGKYDTYVDIQRNTPTSGSSNEQIPNWNKIGESCWVNINQTTASEIKQGKDFQIDKTLIEMYPTDITNHDRIVIVETGEIYKVLAVEKPKAEYLITTKKIS